MKLITKVIHWHEKLVLYSITLLVVLFLFSTTASLAKDMPKQLQVADSLLHLNGQATRKRLFFVKIYDVGLYLPKHISDQKQITQDIPQAFTVVIRYESNKKVGIPQAWREELLPALTQQQKKNLKSALSNAKTGEMFRIEYAPKHGTKILLGNEVILSESSYQIMSAFIDVWLGPKPISRRLAKALLPQ